MSGPRSVIRFPPLGAVLAVSIGLATLCLPTVATAETLDRFYAGKAKYLDSLIRGPDGRVWFAYLNGVGAVDPDGRVTLHRIPGVEPDSVTTGPDGALWITDFIRDLVVRRDMSGAITRYKLRADSRPGAITTGPDGDLWFTTDRGLASMTLDGQTTEHPVAGDDRVWALTSGPGGAIWFVTSRAVGRMTPQGDSQLWRVPGTGGFPESIVAGPDGNVWAADFEYRSLLRVTPTGEMTFVRAGPQASHVTVGPDGNLWFTYYYGVGRVSPTGASRMLWPEPFGGGSDCGPYEGLGPDGGLAFDATGTLWAGSSFARSLVRVGSGLAGPSPLEPFLPRKGALADTNVIARGFGGHVWISGPRRIVRVDAAGARKVYRRVGRDPGDLLPARDGSVWFTAGRGIDRLLPGGRVRRYRRGFSRRGFVSMLARGPDGNLWFVDRRRDAVGRMTPRGHVRMFRGLPRRVLLGTIAAGRRHLWVADESGAVIRVSTSGRLRRFTRGLSRKADPTAITRGPDGAMWFTEFDGHRIGRITTRGRITEFRVHESPAAITTGPDGALWFTTAATDEVDTTAGVGRITVGGRVDQFYAHRTCTGKIRGLVTGPDGKLWFLEHHGPVTVGRLDPQRLVETGALG